MVRESEVNELEQELNQQRNNGRRNDSPTESNGHSKQRDCGSEERHVEPLGMRVDELVSKLARIESALSDLHELVANGQMIKDSYTTLEVAKVLNKKPYTVREWCRLQRVNADKAMCGRGSEEEWRISHEELVRIQNEGLLPPPSRY